jgi:hypothetical protein
MAVESGVQPGFGRLFMDKKPKPTVADKMLD